MFIKIGVEAPFADLGHEVLGLTLLEYPAADDWREIDYCHVSFTNGPLAFNRAELSMVLDKLVQFRLYLLIGYIDRRFMDFEGFVDRQLERRADIDQRRVRKCAALFEMRLAYVSLGERFEVGFFEGFPKGLLDEMR